MCLQGLEEPQPVLGVYKELQIPKERKHFPAKVKHIRTPNEVCELMGLFKPSVTCFYLASFIRHSFMWKKAPYEFIMSQKLMIHRATF